MLLYSGPMTSSTARGSRSIVVTGAGSAAAAPDVVVLAIAIRVDADDVSTALARSATTVTEVSAAAAKHGPAARDIGSTGAGVQPRWDKDGQAVVGYTAYHQLRLVVRSLDTVGAVVSACADAAGNTLSVDSISLDLSDRAPLERSALDAAYAHALAKATQLATLAGAALGQVRTLQEGTAGGLVPPSPMYAMRTMAGAMDSMPIQAGENTVTASVTVEWEIVDPS